MTSLKGRPQTPEHILARSTALRIPLSHRFWSKVNKTETCWLWTGCLRKGTGMVRGDEPGTRLSAHVVAWEMTKGPVPEGFLLVRLCTSRACINPEHRSPRKPLSFEERLWANTEKTDTCWLWHGLTNKEGYGRTKNEGKSLIAHRAFYELLVGPIPEGLTLDHLCRVRNCVRPDHLEPVTSGENVLRGDGPCARNARKEFCVRGHPLSDAYVANGGRYCQVCGRDRMREWRARREFAA